MDPRLWRLALLPVLAFPRGSHLAAGGFLSAPKTPVLGIIGNRVLLPCQVGSIPVPQDFSIRWTFHGESQSRRIPVSSYPGKGRREEPEERYRGRVEFFHEEFRAGNVSLLLRDVRSSDQGSYSCQLSSQDVSWEVQVELEVAAVGEAPSVILRGPERRGLALSCRASGWFPRPELLWLDGRGRARPEPVATTATVTPEGLFSIEGSVRIQPGSELDISCRVLNRRLNASRQARVRIQDTFFPSISIWLRIFLAVLFLNLALISGISCLLQRSHKRTVTAEKAKLEMEEEKKKVKSVLDEEKAKKRAAKIEFKKHFGQLKAELDFWEARSHAVPVALDPEARSLAVGDAQEPLPVPVPVLVARDPLGAGNRYWEVELGREQRWVLGVLRAGPSLPGPHSLDPQNPQNPRNPRDYPELCALRASQGQLFSSGGRALGKQRRDLAVLGVLLDVEKRQLEFYDVEKKDLVAGIPLEDPTGEFFPFVSQGEGGMPRVRPVPVPVPL